LYATLWRLLPGPRPVRALLALLLLISLVAVLFVWVFPAVAPLLPFNNGTVTR